MIVLAQFLLSVICFSPFLRYLCTFQCFILFRINITLFFAYFMYALFLQTSLNISLRNRIWLCLLFLHHMCLYSAHNECYIRDIYSLQQLACLSVFSLMQPDSQTHHLPYGSKTLLSSLHFPLRILFILSNPFQMTTTPGSCLISPLSCVYVTGGVWHGEIFTLCIIILYYGTYYAPFFNLRKSVCISVSIDMNLYKAYDQSLHFLDISMSEKSALDIASTQIFVKLS